MPLPGWTKLFAHIPSILSVGKAGPQPAVYALLRVPLTKFPDALTDEMDYVASKLQLEVGLPWTHGEDGDSQAIWSMAVESLRNRLPQDVYWETVIAVKLDLFLQPARIFTLQPFHKEFPIDDFAQFAELLKATIKQCALRDGRPSPRP